MAVSPRAVALETLGRLRTGRVTAADALAAPGAEALDERDRGFLQELVLGTLRRRGWLDFVISGLSSRPIGTLTPGVLDALRLGAYQLLYLRVADHAAVSESVELARAAEPRSAGFANAVLRRLQREGPQTAPDPIADPLGWLTSAGSLPSWLAERWCSSLGPEGAVARARSLLDPLPTYFRTNPRVKDAPARLAASGIEWRESGIPGALERVFGSLRPLAAQGVVYVQDVGSQMVAHLAALDGLVLDACAAPGGKALLMGDLGGRATRVIAAEASRRRLSTLSRLRSRWGSTNVSVLGADALRPPFAAAFDSVLLDAPCSGLGTLARNPDARWRLAPAEIDRHAARQRALLESAGALVRPGGRLVYATCSIEPEENEGVLTPFLQKHPEFASEGLPSWAEPFRADERLRIDPARHRVDAFFAARLRRKG